MGLNIDDLMIEIDNDIESKYAKYDLIGFVGDNGDNKYIIVNCANLDSKTNNKGLISHIKMVNSNELMQIFRDGKTNYSSLDKFKEKVTRLSNDPDHILSKNDIDETKLKLVVRRYTVLNNIVACCYIDINTMKVHMTTKNIESDEGLMRTLFSTENPWFIDRFSCGRDMGAIMMLFDLNMSRDEFPYIQDHYWRTKLSSLYSESLSDRGKRKSIIELVAKKSGEYVLRDIGWDLYPINEVKKVRKVIDSKFSEVLNKLNNKSNPTVELTHVLVFGDSGSLKTDKSTGKLIPIARRVGFIGVRSTGERLVIIPRVSKFDYLQSLNITNGTVYMTSGGYDTLKYPQIRLKTKALGQIQIGDNIGGKWVLKPEWQIPEIIRFFEAIDR